MKEKKAKGEQKSKRLAAMIPIELHQWLSHRAIDENISIRKLVIRIFKKYREAHGK